MAGGDGWAGMRGMENETVADEWGGLALAV